MRRNCTKVIDHVKKQECSVYTKSPQIHYVNNVSIRFITFLSNRLTKVHQWRFVKSADNPADYCSRDLKSFKKLPDELHDPTFLTAASNDGSKVLAPPVLVELVKTKRVAMAAEDDATSSCRGN
ncbi:unnamed protein product [Echinostoma caproni]|uniref:Reverse transcriptase n=1 Tax=Echinostoma caproni TaxID=27848 RepID=A0A183AUX8_9TREM|nr:unnamed protein product [Echinostoma caproni]